ncbi:flagellar motor switch protein FliN [Methylohalobius crimeensis]|uniref:flagellar motor switch protein FliN n=1 Tax=Methylohalobius crimeensis TaxID=244365 RepID=UPI0003B351C3|nr:flagellar motor switch protein FliN [Methylohalobius crimeensis]
MSDNEELEPRESIRETQPEDSTGEDGELLEEDWEAALAEQTNQQESSGDEEYTPATYDRFEQDKPSGRSTSEDLNLDVILDVPVTLSMEIGRTRISIRNLLQLNQGSVVELDRLAGEPMDIMVNGTLIAHGEVVVVNDRFGIRLTDVISPAERVRRLR